MLSRTAQCIAACAVSLAVAMLALVSCASEPPTAGSISTHITSTASAPERLSQRIPPCIPIPGSSVDPCEADAPPFEMGAANSIPLLGAEPVTIREMLDDDLSGWVTHVVLRGTYIPDTTRCTAGERFRPPLHLQGEFSYTANSLSFKCYVDVRANAYITSAGPSELTVMVFRYAYFDGQYARSAKEGQTEQDSIDAQRRRFESVIEDFFPGREHVMFLGPPVDTSAEVWRLMGYWDVQRQDSGSIIAVHPRRDLWLSIKTEEYKTHISKLEMKLPALIQAVTSAHQARVTEYEGRIGEDEDLPDLVNNANELRDYYTEVGAYAPGVPTPAPPPPPYCGTAALGPADNPGLMRDCMTLLGLKDALRGTAALNWSVDTPIADWDGVTVGGTPSRVTELSLFEKLLTGEVPAALGRLTELEKLNLGYNRFTGGIPPELGSLSRLDTLDLSTSRLKGEVPAELGDLASLRILNLAQNQLTGQIPSELGDMPELWILDLNGNRLTGDIPPELGGLTNLGQLHLSGNMLTGGIPARLGDLASLDDLDLSRNGLTGGIPPELGSLAALTALFLNDNQLTGEIPARLEDLESLARLYLSGNTLSGCIPPALADVQDNDLPSLDLPNCASSP